MPQFEPSVAMPQIVWLIAVFAILYLIVRAAMPKVERVAATRAGVIGSDLTAAEQAKASAAAIIADYEASVAGARTAAAKLTGEARDATAAATAERLKGIDADLADQTAAAMARIEQARAAAHASVSDVAAGAAADIVERLTGRRPEPDEITAATGA